MFLQSEKTQNFSTEKGKQFWEREGNFMVPSTLTEKPGGRNSQAIQ